MISLLAGRRTGPAALAAATLVGATWLAGGCTSPAQAKRSSVTETVVSLAFDDGYVSQYSLAFQRGLQPRGLHGSFYIITGLTRPDTGKMTWSQLSGLYNKGNDVGGHTVNHIDLTSSSYTLARKTAEVCDNFQSLKQHGLDPFSFNYPDGTYDATTERIVQSCGFRTARADGGLGTAGVYAESIPPKDLYATRTIYNAGGAAPLTLAWLKDSVTAAAQHGGGWVTFVFHQICSKAYDPANYGLCLNRRLSWAPIELANFNTFLDWLQKAGRPGGAPAGTVVRTLRQVITAGRK